MSRVLYQPVLNQAINDNSAIIRGCQDRLDAMVAFCENKFGSSLSEKSFLDIGSCYGFFVNAFNGLCSIATGIENGNKEFNMTRIFYPDISSQINKEDFTETIDGYQNYDIVSLLSVLHSIIISDGADHAAEILRKIDAKTNDVLFIDMGQENELIYNSSMSGWNKDSIAQWVLNETSFDVCEPLIEDSDPRFGRTLFACYRNK
jgi:hypothetical protein